MYQLRRLSRRPLSAPTARFATVFFTRIGSESGELAAALWSQSRFDRAARFVNLFLQIRSASRQFSLNRSAPCVAAFLPIDDLWREGNSGFDLGDLFRLDVELPQLVLEMVPEEDVIDFAVLAHRVEVEFLK